MVPFMTSLRGNPDFQHDPDRALSPDVTLTVATFQEASAACEAYRSPK
jgi:hypothetical protein